MGGQLYWPYGPMDENQGPAPCGLELFQFDWVLMLLNQWSSFDIWGVRVLLGHRVSVVRTYYMYTEFASPVPSNLRH